MGTYYSQLLRNDLKFNKIAILTLFFPKGLNQHLLSLREESKRVKMFLASKATSNSMILE